MKWFWCWLSVVLINNKLIITDLNLCKIVLRNAENNHCSNNAKLTGSLLTNDNRNPFKTIYSTRTPCACLGQIWIIYATNINVTSLKRDAFLLLNMTVEFSAAHFILEHLLENANSVTAVRTACTGHVLYTIMLIDLIIWIHISCESLVWRHNPGPKRHFSHHKSRNWLHISSSQR